MKCTTQSQRSIVNRVAKDGPYAGNEIPFYEGQADTIVFTAKGQRGRYRQRGTAVWQPL